jgi:hypothetical protein
LEKLRHGWKPYPFKAGAQKNVPSLKGLGFFCIHSQHSRAGLSKCRRCADSYRNEPLSFRAEQDDSVANRPAESRNLLLLMFLTGAANLECSTNMRFLLLLLIAVQAVGQDKPKEDFLITLERTACLGNCPDYVVTIHGDGSVLYEGRYSVRAEGVRKATISPQAVRTLVQRLRREDFFSWEEKKVVCVDYPEVHITVDLNGQHKRVIEGCNTPGKVLKLADEIDRISGAKRWVGNAR